MKQVLIKSGSVVIEDVPAPFVGRKNILVRVTHSCISAGTEIAGVRMSGLPLYQRALKQPDNVKRVFEMVRDQGVMRTMDRVRGKLSAGSATGYSAAGVVIEVGDDVDGFTVGDRVACAGAGIANHAEIIDVPVNLAVKVPEGLDLGLASTVTLGAIAMQGVRRAQPTIGETIVVVGLGILGQLTAQILSANGCRVIGVDPDPERVNLALANGMDFGLNPGEASYVESLLRLTDGLGADASIVTAATSSDQVISDAMQSCRKKGRVVVVGDIGLNLKRADFYKKELDFLISSSYGPGRYDPYYEEEGQDYPIAFVRWTENRNMQAYIALLAKGRVRLDNLLSSIFPVERATDAYNALKSEGSKPLIVLLEYPERADQRRTRVELAAASGGHAKIRIALAGASGFAQGMHLPNLLKLRDRYSIHAIMSRTGANAKAVSLQYGASYCTTDYRDILSDRDVDLVMITSRHNLHGQMVLAALQAGKSVFVEKPLALTGEEVGAIEAFYREKGNDAPLLMTGFNRRFSPAMSVVKSVVAKSTTPFIANYRMNAGFISPEHWVHGAEGGGRNIGEACHIYDLFHFLAGSNAVESVSACGIRPQSAQWKSNDNFVATVKYANGSICTLTYTALGDKSYPKEKLEVFCDGKVIAMDDYKSVTVSGMKHKGWSSPSSQKGQMEELKVLGETMGSGKPWPISLADQLSVTRLSLEIERQIGLSAGATSEP